MELNELADARGCKMSVRRLRRRAGGASAAGWRSATIFVALAMTSTAAARLIVPAHESRPEAIESDGPTAEPASAIAEREEKQRRRNVASVLVLLLVGVGLIGVLMIVAALMWGAKLRRLARDSAAGPTRQNELWYLKTPPPPDHGGLPHPPLHAGDQPSAPPSTGGDPTTGGESRS
jgi:hypothetical protein